MSSSVKGISLWNVTPAEPQENNSKNCLLGMKDVVQHNNNDFNLESHPFQNQFSPKIQVFIRNMPE